MKDSCENNLLNSKRKSNLIETDDGKEFVTEIFTDLLNKDNVKVIVVLPPRSCFCGMLQPDYQRPS